jgi:peptidoglycan/LPS O-acetylase OafA/YrhL
MPARSSKLEGFDGLRALAALSVLTYHVALWSGYGAARPLTSLLWELKGGVAVFFVISGALLYLPYARAVRDRGALPDWRGYARRRVIRIVPGYWVALTVFAAGPFGAFFAANLWRYYSLSQIYQPRTLFSGLGVAWSLCVEVTFYALLPLFAWVAARLAAGGSPRASARVQIGLIAAVGCASLALRGLVAGSLIAPTMPAGTTLMVSLPGTLDWFAIGMMLAVLRAELEVGRATHGVIAALGRRPLACAVLSLSLFVAGTPFQHGDVFLPWYGLATHLAIGLGSGVLVLAAIVPHASRGLVPRLLRHPVAVWLGTVSYGIYLWHFPVLQLIARHLSRHPASEPAGVIALVWLAVLAGGVALGAASWYLVEQPFQRVFGRRARAPRPAGQLREIDATVQPQADAA